MTRRALSGLALLLAVTGGGCAARRLPTMSTPVSLVLSSPAGAEHLVQVRDFHFAYYERIFYQRRAPRAEEATGRRTEVEDRRHECLCVKMQDYSDIKFRKLRQIEIVYPDERRAARLRLTRRNGEVREYPIEALYGGVGSFAPRFAATVDSQLREFPLIPGEGAEAWPSERLVRVLLARPPAPRSARPSARPRKKPPASAPDGD